MQEEEKKNPEQPAPEKEPETEPTKEPETEPAKEPEEPPAGEPTVETEGEGEQPQADPEKEKLMRELTIARAQAGGHPGEYRSTDGAGRGDSGCVQPGAGR